VIDVTFMTSKTKRGKRGKTQAKTPANVQTVTCECGTRILVLPDVKAMSTAIEAHVKSHETKNGALTEEDQEVIRDDLIAKVFKKITENYNS
jgi:hypothetical protein